MTCKPDPTRSRSDAAILLQLLAHQTYCLDITRDQLAEHLGVSRNTIRNWVKHPDKAPMGLIDKWAKHVHMQGLTLRRIEASDETTYPQLAPTPSAQDIERMVASGTYDHARYAPPAPLMRVKDRGWADNW